MAYSPSTVKPAVKHVLSVGHVPMLWGSPSTAKTSILRELAVEANLKVIYCDLSMMDTIDLNGVITKNKDNTRGLYLPMELFPLEGDSIPSGYKGFLLIFDELSNCPPSYLQSVYSLMYEKRLGQYNLHSKCHVAAAGNLITDRSGVHAMPNALKPRLVHFEVELPYKIWHDSWAIHNVIDHRILSFLEGHPDQFYTFDPESSNNTYSCGRTWHRLSEALTNIKTISNTHLCLIEGYISRGIALEFITHCDIYLSKDMPTFPQIITDPANVYFDPAPSYQYALSGLLAANADKNNLATCLQFLERLLIEFRIISVKQIIAKNPILLNEQSIEDFITTYSEEFS